MSRACQQKDEVALGRMLVELRVPKYGRRQNSVLSGYYNDPEKLVKDARQADGMAAGIYFTMNPVNPALLSRRFRMR
jgi:hypothetical protein